MAERRKPSNKSKRPKARESSKFAGIEIPLYADDEIFEEAKNPHMEYRSFNESTYAKERRAKVDEGEPEKKPKKEARFYQGIDEAKKVETRAIYKKNPKDSFRGPGRSRPRTDLEREASGKEFRGSRDSYRDGPRKEFRGPKDSFRGSGRSRPRTDSEREPSGKEFRGTRDSYRDGPRKEFRGPKDSFRGPGRSRPRTDSEREASSKEFRRPRKSFRGPKKDEEHGSGNKEGRPKTSFRKFNRKDK